MGRGDEDEGVWDGEGVIFAFENYNLAVLNLEKKYIFDSGMKKQKLSKKFVSFLILINITLGYSQRANFWYFGNTAGLNFNITPPTLLTNGLTSNADNTSTISDKNGNLLFYTTGMNVWNKNHSIMPNGSGLVGSFSGGQCALIVPIPCDSNKYAIFHTTDFSAPGFLNYTVVDMSLNAGLGDVIASQKNVSLGSGWTEKLCAYYNPVGNFYWVVSHKWNSNQFVAFKVDASTIATQSVVSSIGSVHNCGSFGGAHDAMGQLTISQDGSKIANALTCQDKYELFDFNITTGILSNFIQLPGNGGNAWATAFSPDSKKLYTNSIFGQGVFQYDLTNYNLASIVASKHTQYLAPSTGYNFGYMELGPDGKLYIAKPSATFISVINTPNGLGAASGFQLVGPSIAPKTSSHGLSRIAYNIPNNSFTTGNFSLTSSVTNGLCGALSSATITPSSPTLTLSYNWIPGNYTSTSVSNLAAGVYTVTGTSPNCSFATIQFTVTQTPNLTVSLNSVGVCKNASVNLVPVIAGGVPNYSYTWLPSNANTASITITPTASTVYSLLVNDTQGCSKTTTVAVNVNTVTANFNFSQNCTTTITTSNSSMGAMSYTWNFGNGSTSNQLQPNYSYTNSGSYTITLIATSSAGCKDTLKKSITVVSPPISSFSLQTNLCSKTVSITNNSLNGNSYAWNFGDGTTSILQNPLTHTYPAAGTYSIWLVVTNSAGCKDSTSALVSFSTITSSFNVTQNNCNGTITTTNTSVNGSTFLWNFGDNTTSSVQQPIHTYSNSGTYTITLIATSVNSCADTIQKVVTISPFVSAGFIANIPNCSAIASFTNNSSNAVSYFWKFGDGSTSSLQNPSTHTYSTSGTYNVWLIATNALGCKDSVMTVVNATKVNANFNFIQHNCNGVLTTTNLSTGATIFNWDFGNGFGSLQQTPTHVYTNSGTFTITLIASNSSNCKDTIQQTVTVNPLVNSSFTAQLNACDSVAAFTNLSFGANTYNWNFGDGSSSTLANPATHTYLASGTYTVWLKVTNTSGCKDSMFQVLTVIKKTIPNFNVVVQVCKSTINVTNTMLQLAPCYWQFGDGSSSNSINPLTHTYNSAGIYSITLTTNPNLACSASITKTIEISFTTKAQFSYSAAVCDKSIQFFNTSIGSLDGYWNFGDNFYSSEVNPIHYYSNNGTYTVSLTAAPNSSCNSTTTLLVNVNNTDVVANFNYTNPQDTYDAIFKNTSSNATNFFWDFGDGQSSVLINPIHTFTNMGTQVVCLLASNELGCNDTLCKVISIDAGWTFYVPNTFTPNGDNLNDQFYAFATNIKNLKLSVYDRWGEIIFSTTDIYQGWNATYKGKEVQNGVYVWKAEFSDFKSKFHSVTGHIQVLR